MPIIFYVAPALCFKEILVSVSEDGEIIDPKYVGAM
jgi:hypothetical protein